MGYDMALMQSCGDEEKDYFRLNIGGVHRWAIPHMKRMGMVVVCDYSGDWPAVPDDAPDDYDHDFSEAYIAFVGQQVEAPGIPTFKFSSNDGWLVQEDECKSALKAYREHGELMPGDADYLWMNWIDFLERASTHGGFRVW